MKRIYVECEDSLSNPKLFLQLTPEEFSGIFNKLKKLYRELESAPERSNVQKSALAGIAFMLRIFPGNESARISMDMMEALEEIDNDRINKIILPIKKEWREELEDRFKPGKSAGD